MAGEPVARIVAGYVNWLGFSYSNIWRRAVGVFFGSMARNKAYFYDRFIGIWDFSRVLQFRQVRQSNEKA